MDKEHGEDYRKAVGERIRMYRIRCGLSQGELAKRCGYTSRSTIAKIESGLNEFPQSMFKQLAEVLNVSPLDLLGYEDDTSLTSRIKAEQGQTVADAFSLFLRLDDSDKMLIIGQMQGILMSSDKYKEQAEPKATQTIEKEGDI